MSKLKKLPERKINKKQLEVLWKYVEPRVSEIFEKRNITPYIKGMKLIDGYHNFGKYWKLLRLKVAIKGTGVWITLYLEIEKSSNNLVDTYFEEKEKSFTVTPSGIQECIEWKNKKIMPDIIDWSYVDKPYKPKDWKWIGDYY